MKNKTIKLVWNGEKNEVSKLSLKELRDNYIQIYACGAYYKKTDTGTTTYWFKK